MLVNNTINLTSGQFHNSNSDIKCIYDIICQHLCPPSWRGHIPCKKRIKLDLVLERRVRGVRLELAGHIPCKKHIKLDLVLEWRVREAWSVQDAILITSIYASHVSACSPRCGANPKPKWNRQLPLQNTFQTRSCARTARA